MKTRELWLVIAALVVLNALTFFYFLSRSETASGFHKDSETVAKVGKDTISREEWLNELEARYGKDTLRDLVDREVVSQMAKKYKITVPKADVERELRMFQTAYGGSSSSKGEDLERWRKQIELSLLLEEILTKDAVVSESEMKSYFEKNKTLYDVPAAYRLSHIVIKTKDEADQAIKELEGGSGFETLARERSEDEFTAGEGGDIGFIQAGDERYPDEYTQTAQKLKIGHWSKPIKIGEGYAIIKLHEKIAEKKYSYKEVKHEIRRQIALAQLGTPPSAAALWDEAGVDWFFGK
ncbi:peptidylprolyl isomerase [Neobacillus piezotolerans]|uniref:peptidylprolyl isomerase n=1 Tax=Neobacillus piezotolerans TaxID=2259171 RepID=A0A3D8GK03_9BACI|nr:peptidyl-prolyl cis-trans isomerase [Neobacillus piezotolerans]RDU34780.1 peptidylprolyl isomerase [Neobacillus piezotolerans]